MKSDKIKGLTVKIGGDTTELGKALDESKKKSQPLRTELGKVNRLLKFDPKNVELAAQKEQILTEQVDETKKKLNLLKSAQEDINKLYKNGEIGEAEYRDFQREIISTKEELKKYEIELKDVKGSTEKLQRKTDEITFKNAESKLDHLKGKFKDFRDSALDGLEAVSKSSEKIGDGLEKAGSFLNKGSAVAAGTLGASVKFAMDFEDAMAKVSTIADESEVSLDDLKQQILDLSDKTGISSTEIAENVYDAISAGQNTADAVNFVKNSTSLAKAGFTDAASALDILTTIMNAYGLEANKVGEVSDTLIMTQNLGKTTVAQLAENMGKVIPTANAYSVGLDQLAAAYSITTANGINTANSTTYINKMLDELGKSGTKASDTLKKKTGKSFQELMQDGASLSDVLEIIAGSAAEGVNYFNKISSTIKNATGKSFDELQNEGYSLSQIMELIDEKNGDNKRSFNELDQALKDGTGKSFKQLNEEGYSLSEILALVDEKTEGSISSFNDMWGSSNAAKAAVTILGGSADEFNDRLKEMKDSTGATDTALDKLSTTSAKTKKIINTLKNAGIELGDEVLEQAAPILLELVDNVKEFTTWLKKLTPEEKKTLTTAIEIFAVLGPGVTVLGKTFKGIGSITGALPKLVKAYKTSKLAQEGLTAAMSANPFGSWALAIGVFVGAVAAGAAAIEAFHQAKREGLGFNEQVDNMQAALDKITDIKNEVNETADAIKNNFDEATSSLSSIDYYKDRLDELLSKADLTPEEQAELTTIGDYFKDKTTEFAEAWDEYIKTDDNGKLKLTGNADEIIGKLDDIIDKYRKVAAQNALSSLMQETSEASLDMRTKTRDAGVELINARNELDKFLEEWNLTDEKSVNTLFHETGLFDTWENKDKSKTASVNDLKEQYEKLTKAFQNTNGAYKDVIASAAQVTSDEEQLYKLSAVLNGSYEDADAVMTAYNEGLITTSDIEKSRFKSLKNLKKELKETSHEFGSSDNIKKYISDISKTGLERAQAYLDTVNSSAEQSKEKVKETAEGIAKTSKAIGEIIKENIDSAGKETEEIVDSSGKKAAKKTELNAERMNNAMEELHFGETVGKNMDEAENAVEDKAPSLEVSAENTAKKTQNAAKIGGWSGIGSTWIGSLISGIFSKNRDGENAGKSAAETVKDGVGGVSLFSAGQNMISGFINGLKDGSLLKDLWGAASDLAGGVLDTIKKKLGIASPAKEGITIGQFLGKGFAKGIVKGKPEVVSKAREMAKAARESLAEIDGFYELGKFPSTPRQEIFTNYTVEQTKAETAALAEMSKKLDKAITAIEENSQKYIVLDSGELVGATVTKIDSSLAALRIKKERGR